MAEKCGKLPWEIDKSTPAIIWFIRYEWWLNTYAEIEQKTRRKAQRGRR